MAGKSKHGYQLRQKLTKEWEILAKDSEGKEFWYGNFTMKQNAVRWGDSHQIEGRFPQVVVNHDDPFGIVSSPAVSVPVDPVKREFQKLCVTSGVNQEDKNDVMEFTGQPADLLQSVVDYVTGKTIWQPLG